MSTIGEVRARWKEADLIRLSLASQLTAFRAALGRIQEWMGNEMPEPHHQLVMDLDSTLSCCRILIDRVDALFTNLESQVERPKDTASRWGVAFGNKSLDNVMVLIERQTSALTLLLTACTW